MGKSISKITWDEFKAYLFYDRMLSRGESSYTSNKSRFLKVSNWFKANKLEFNRKNFNGFIQYCADSNYAPDYINGLIIMSTHIASYLGAEDMKDLKYLPNEREIDIITLTPDEISKIARARIDYLRDVAYLNLRNRTIILLIGSIGLRTCEAIDLEWIDVHLDDPIPNVIIKRTKTYKQRICPITKEVSELLKTLPKNSKYVFVSYRGKKLRTQQIDLDLKRRAKAVGIEKHVWTYLLRHSVGTTFGQLNMGVLQLGKLLGHSDPKTTMRYFHTNLTELLEAMSIHPFFIQEISWADQVKKFVNVTEKSIAEKFVTKKIIQNDKIIFNTRKP